MHIALCTYLFTSIASVAHFAPKVFLNSTI